MAYIMSMEKETKTPEIALPECPECFGTGCLHIHDYMIDEPCEYCGGTGFDDEETEE